MSETISVEFAIGEIRTLARRIPKLRRFLSQQVLLKVIERGIANILGGVMPATHENRELMQYFSAAMRARMRDDGATLWTGLPADDEAARILAFRNTGGTIYPKQDRPNPHLRIPQPPALYEQSGKDRFSGVLLRKLPPEKNPFVIEKERGGWGRAWLVKKSEFSTRPVRMRGETIGHEQVAGERWYELVKSKYEPPQPWWDRTTEEVTAVLQGFLQGALEAFQHHEAERKAAN